MRELMHGLKQWQKTTVSTISHQNSVCYVKISLFSKFRRYSTRSAAFEVEVGATMTQRTIKEAAANDAWTTTAIMGESSASLLIHCMQYQAINRCFHSHVL